MQKNILALIILFSPLAFADNTATASDGSTYTTYSETLEAVTSSAIRVRWSITEFGQIKTKLAVYDCAKHNLYYDWLAPGTALRSVLDNSCYEAKSMMAAKSKSQNLNRKLAEMEKKIEAYEKITGVSM